MLASFAMAMDVSIDFLIDELGHDGSEIIYPDLDDPRRRRGFHPQEFVHVGLKIGKPIVHIEKEPMLGVDDMHVSRVMPNTNLFDYIANGNYVLVYPGHAVASDGQWMFDPSGRVFLLDYSPVYTHLFIVF